MNFLTTLQISASGLSAQRLRINIISSNLANINTTKTPEGGPYKRREPVFAAVPIEQTFQEELNASSMTNFSEVEVIDIVKDERPPILKYAPDHPDANEEGYIASPNINVMEEMVNLMEASRSYEANVMSANATKNMILKALEIGK